MRLRMANHSSYPRVGEGREAQRVRRAYAQRERGKIDDAGYTDVVGDVVTEIIKEQEEAGVDLVTDGQVGWYDLVSRPTSRLDGIKIDGLLRFFDTNYLVRQPEVVGKISGSFGLADDYRRASGVTSSEVKAVVTGPYTLARHSILSDGADVASVTAAYAEAAAQDVSALAEAGARIIQVEEPSLLAHPDDAALVRDALERIAGAKGGARISLVTYFGRATPMLDEIFSMPADIFGFDLTYDPDLAGALENADRPLALGLLDARNTKPDDIETTARTVETIAEAVAARGVDELHLQPSCGLEYLPRDRAKRKLERMQQIREAATKVGT